MHTEAPATNKACASTCGLFVSPILSNNQCKGRNGRRQTIQGRLSKRPHCCRPNYPNGKVAKVLLRTLPHTGSLPFISRCGCISFVRNVVVGFFPLLTWSQNIAWSSTIPGGTLGFPTRLQEPPSSTHHYGGQATQVGRGTVHVGSDFDQLASSLFSGQIS